MAERSQLQWLMSYLQELAPHMGLRDWTFAIMDAPPEDEGHGAEVTVLYGQKMANFRFRGDWPEWDADELRSTCVHEMTHLHINQVFFATQAYSPLLGTLGYEPLHNSITLAVENATDGISRAWAELLPLPERNRKKRKVKS